ncbi:MAG TPA: DUF4268 domain-containing protein, partial [Anaerolineales bacterium]|nr:DUF4268 domain-containing protein [Anaerolineales bacterium]
AFDLLLEQKEEIEKEFGPIEWERLDNRRASRLAVYKDGQITDKDLLPELINWAVDILSKMHKALTERAEKAIQNVKK